MLYTIPVEPSHFLGLWIRNYKYSKLRDTKNTQQTAKLYGIFHVLFSFPSHNQSISPPQSHFHSQQPPASPLSQPHQLRTCTTRISNYLLMDKCRKKTATYQAITAIPRKALTMLNTNATTPFAVNPSGKGAGLTFAPFISKRSSVFPAALPDMGMFCFVHASICPCGSDSDSWSARGASIMVAMRPDATCHSIWQWKSQMPGLSARKRRTMLLFGWTMKVSRFMGTVGKVEV